MYQVHVRETPGHPRRAVAFALVMICLATGAAALFVRLQRSGQPGNRLHPPDWSVSFVPPAGWVRLTVDARAAGAEPVCFYEPARGAKPSVLCVSRVRVWGARSAQRICHDAIASFFPDRLGRAATIALLRRVEYEEAFLGPLDGVRAVLADTGTIFVVGVAGTTPLGTEAYVLEYHRDGALEPHDLTVCDRVARSFQRR
jgi:hypothetical protein